MRVRFQWKVQEPLELLLNYQQMLQGVIYRNIQDDSGYSSFVHKEGYSYEQRKFRMFSFSKLMGKCYVRQKRIYFTEWMAFEVCSPDVHMIRILADTVSVHGLRFGQQIMEKVEIYVSDEEVETEEIVVRAISPIVIHKTDEMTKKTYYFHPEDELFTKAVSDNFIRKYIAYYGVVPECGIYMEPMEVTEKDKCVTTYKKTYITGYSGIYRLIGPRKYLNFLYQTGVGSKNAQGFGMIQQIEMK